MLKFLNNKLLGGTLLLTGTAMGGGLLALPIVTAEAGFFSASLLMIGCWVLMTTSALLTLEISLWLPNNANIISMTKTFLNKGGTLIAWITYLLLLYSIVAAYIAGGSDFLVNLTSYYTTKSNIQPLAAVLFTALLGSIVYRGIGWVDYLNRALMMTKLVIYTLLVALVLPQISANNLALGNISYLTKGFGVVITSFSYNNVIPSLRTYFQEDIKGLRKAILIGSTIPLVCYILWNASVMGIIPLYGHSGLIQLSYSNSPSSALINQLNQLIDSRLLFLLSHSFACVCVLTTFLTCSLGLSDFLADGFNLRKGKTTLSDIIIYSTTFIPPLMIALIFPNLFIKALDYAGIYCLILFVLLPACIAWRGRYVFNYAQKSTYHIAGGKPVLIGLGITAILGIIYSVYRIFY